MCDLESHRMLVRVVEFQFRRGAGLGPAVVIAIKYFQCYLSLKFVL